MIPLSHGGSHSSSGGGSGLALYFNRMVAYSQMDLQYHLWQMLYLVVQPARVYRISALHRQTKNQWARDDPGFVVIMMGFLSIAALAWSIGFGSSLGSFFKTWFRLVAIDFIAAGLAISTIAWWFANNYLRVSASAHSVEQSVEWAYAWDVHCNSYFPLFLMLYVGQYFFVWPLMGSSFLITVVADLLYAAAGIYYFYLTFIGYSALPFLSEKTVYYLYPTAAVLVFTMLLIILNVNMTNVVLNAYFG